ncbi:hypothetical protein WMY93_025643 [Mugilogobius chulae]|uniref:SH2 domain-containing protein n=1 Tax=Mugilogobius chulae TaxID=88201 RepID=A0AAW0MV85_9GOBI
MAKWFKDFPINLKNGNERARSASESGPQTRSKPSFARDSLKGSPRKDGGVGGLLAGRNRKNSATELGRNNAGSGGTVWDSLTSVKSRKNSKIETSPEEQRQVRSSSLAQTYISRMIKVDKQQDKTPKGKGTSGKQNLPENDKGKTDIKTTLIILEDYADPFDAEKTKEQREAERAGVNDGYMEPYDAQVIITEVRRRGSKDLLKVCVLVDRGQTRVSLRSWYHGSVSRQQAEAQLQRCREASFLVRDSESGTSKYSIALKTSHSCVHIIVAQTKTGKGLGYTLDQSSCVFASIPELVHHYCIHRLPFNGAEHMTLQHPVSKQQ